MSNELPSTSELPLGPPTQPQVDRSRVWRTRIRRVMFAFLLTLPFFAIGEIILCGSMLRMDGHSESVELTGIEVNREIRFWPPSISPQDVKHVSHQIDHSRDSYTERYRMEISAANAVAWQDAIHAHEEGEGHGLSHLYGMEGIHRSIAGPPSLEQQTGPTPSWWTPPSTEYRATEFMLWSHSTGTAHGLYSAYEPATQTLWVYRYCAQHDELWPQGKLPAGTAFHTQSQ
jgi:hypothetical protein